MPIIATPLDGPVWSPDGSRIAFVSSDNGNFRIYTVGPDGSGLTAVTGPEASRQGPTFSPDGKWLAYRLQPMDYGDGTHLAISRPDGSEEQRLISVPERDGATLQASQWSPDSTRLAYSTGAAGNGKSASSTSPAIGRRCPSTPRTPSSPCGRPTAAGSCTCTARARSWTQTTPQTASRSRQGSPTARPPGRPTRPRSWGSAGRARELFRIPVSDPAAATRVDLPPGLINMASWRRTAP